MSVHLIYRTPYNEPNNKYYKRFNENSVLEWFQKLWDFYDPDRYQFYANISEYIGLEMYGFWGLCRGEYDEKSDDYFANKAPPKDLSQVKEYLEAGYVNEVEFVQGKAFQVLTDDDELELAYYIFDDTYALENPTNVAYLIHEGFYLPEAFSDNSLDRLLDEDLRKIKAGDSPALTFLFRTVHYGGDNLTCPIKYRELVIMEGIRLPDLYDYLCQNYIPELTEFRNFLQGSLRKSIERFTAFPKHWYHFWEDKNFPLEKLEKLTPSEGYSYLMEAIHAFEAKVEPERVPQNSIKGPYQYSEHLVQFSINRDSWGSVPILDTTPADLYDHYILFDDLWAAKNRDLAISILAFGKSWKVL